MSNPVDPPELIIDRNLVQCIKYDIDDDGRVHVKSAPGTGARIVQALREQGYAIVLTDHRKRIIHRG